MPIPSRTILGAMAGLCLLAAACGSLAPPESCGPGAEGEPDEARFNELFRSMQLVSLDTGLPGEPDEEGVPQFTAGEELEVAVHSLRELNIRACVQERSHSARIAAQPEGEMPAGNSRIPLGHFEKGDYVVRVLVDRVLVRNLPFRVLKSRD
jgi:hypothetical protein